MYISNVTSVHVGVLAGSIRLSVVLLYYVAAFWMIIDISSRPNVVFRQSGLSKWTWLALWIIIFGTAFFFHPFGYVAAGFAVNYLFIARPKIRRVK